MPSYVIKPLKNEDFYVRYSTVVDNVTHWGTREEILTVSDIDEERVKRADEHGTSSQWGIPPVCGWIEKTLLVRECIIDPTMPEKAFWGRIKREYIHAFCETYSKGYFFPPSGMIQWEEIEDDD